MDDLSERVTSVLPMLNEIQSRQYLATEARLIGRGGISLISRISGVTRVTITKGLKEINSPSYQPNPNSKIRSAGGGRKSKINNHPELLKIIEDIIDPYTHGDSINCLMWTNKSTRKLEKALKELGYNVSDTTIGIILKKLGYSLQVNKKALALKPTDPDRDKQFIYIANLYKKFRAINCPVLSIDTKKKEKIGNFKNNGSEYRKKGDPRKVLDHDFLIKDLGIAVPYGIYEPLENFGFVNVGISSDTAEFAVDSICRYWETHGIKRYPDATHLYITADAGGSNGYRVRLWKKKLQEFADKYNIEVTISHYPPGTSKWNKIEHKMFAFISQNWAGQPLESLATVINLIASTTTASGLVIDCVVDERTYETGKSVSDDEMGQLNLTPHSFLGKFNYTCIPTNKELSSFIAPLTMRAGNTKNP
jgi:transposase